MQVPVGILASTVRCAMDRGLARRAKDREKGATSVPNHLTLDKEYCRDGLYVAVVGDARRAVVEEMVQASIEASAQSTLKSLEDVILPNMKSTSMDFNIHLLRRHSANLASLAGC